MSLSLWFILLVALAAVLAGLLCCVRHRHAPSPENALPSEGLRLNRHPLHYAVFKIDVNTVNRLLGEGASPRQTMADGQTPLHVAAECGLAAMCKFLLKNSAEVDALDNFGGSPLHAAAACQSGEAVRSRRSGPFFPVQIGPKTLVLISAKSHTVNITGGLLMQLSADNFLIMSMEFIAVSTQGRQNTFSAV